MIRAGGGSYRNRLPSLPPPPPPPPPLPQNPSSSSTLSPLARPFTLDHVFHSSPPPPSYHPLPAVDRPSASLLPSHTAISSDGSLRTQPSTGPGADPFAHYYSNSQPPAIVDSFRPSSAFSGVGTDPWNRPFDEEIGHGMRTDAVWSWTEPSLGYKVPPFQEDLKVPNGYTICNRRIMSKTLEHRSQHQLLYLKEYIALGQQKNTKELVKAMHDSSIKLLCTNFSGDDELEPHDYRLLYSVINNIALVLKDKKVLVIPLWSNMVQ
ncbi:hypothetical protein GW17_00039286 [Ensete ventricosum]|nr:hypothetical protein GW17_00039286 [Ensete ventricosum]RZS23145.1 hypothetical protein BHM03_00056011 [Ensete ventricosum]